MTTEISESLRFERQGDVGILTLNRPRKRNALNDDTILALGSFFRSPPDGIRAVVLNAAGDHFCAGLDLSELTERDAVGGLHHSRMWHNALGELADGTIPVVAVLRGAVVGGGLELAAAAHIRVAEPSAFFALPEGQRGLFVGGGASVRVPRLIGVARMQDMMLTGRVLSAEEGERLGLATYLVDDGLATALDLAAKIATNSPVTNYAVLQALPRIAEVGPQEGLMMESLMAAVAQSSSEAKEKMGAFLDGSGPKVAARPVRADAAPEPSSHSQGVLRPVPDDARKTSRVGAYLDWLETERGRSFDDWNALQHWSSSDIEEFWESIWDYFGVVTHAPYSAVLTERVMPGAQWFPGARINYAEHSLGTDADLDTVIVKARSQTRDDIDMTFAELRDEVRRVRAGLAELGVQKGDRVAGYLPNIPETLIAFLATVSLGAVWAACAPEFGAPSVIDRFGQIEPTVLFVVGGYTYGAKPIDRRDEVAQIRQALPGVRAVVSVPYGSVTVDGEVTSWNDLGGNESGDPGSLPDFEPVPFDHPLVVLFSSGTTGKPKPIVHGHGGILLETMKNHALQFDLGPGDTFSWFSTTAWMMWNTLVGGLVVRSSIVMMDGNPMYPDIRYQWQIAAETRATVMGMSPGVVMTCRREGIEPVTEFDLSAVRQFGAAGSPLPVEGYRWVCDRFGPDVLLNVGSGGTDVCTGIVQASPLTPVYAGEMSGPSLGFAATAFDEDGKEVVGELGELVLTQPVPSMPVKFWGDDDGSRYRHAYFDKYPGVWCHGDWIRFAEDGGVVVTGRSDATLNRGGVRLGTAEFYRVVEELDGVTDSLVVHIEDDQGGMGKLILFVVTTDELTDELRTTISTALRTSLSPRHIPDDIRAIPVVPYNRTGKKLEIPAKRILLGADPATVVAPGSLAQPDSLDAFASLP